MLGCFSGSLVTSAQTGSNLQSITQFRTYNGVRYFAASDLAQLLNVNTYYNPQVQKLILYLPDNRLKLSAHTGFIMVDDDMYHLPHPVLFENGELMVPAEAFVQVLQQPLDIPMQYAASTPAIRFDYSLYNITDVIIEEKKNGTLIRVPITREFRENEYTAWLRPNWFYLTLSGGHLAPHLTSGIQTNGIIRRVVTIQEEGLVQLSFRLRGEVEDYDIYQNSNPRELVMSLRTPRDQTNTQLSEARDRWKLDRIVLDAGHGGKDPGAIGPGGLLEKDVVLDITKRVGRIIEQELPEVEVVYTRTTDVFLELQERTKLANEKNGKLFVSIHANSNPNRSVRGFETYLLRPGRTEEAVEVAERENSVIKYEESTEIYQRYDNETLILATMMQSAFMKESEDFASLVQEGLGEYVPSRNRGVKQAGFYVLVGASMPNILVEVGFMSNSREANQLSDGDHRQKVARGIFNGIVEFKKKYDQQTADQASL